MRKLSNSELQRVSVDEFKNQSKTPIIIFLDSVRSLLNVGSVFRTADAFSIESIYLCGITGKPPHREIQKTALGATESVDWKYFETLDDAVNYFRKQFPKGLIYAVEQADTSIKLNKFSPDIEKKTGLIFGNEINGVDEKIFSSIDGCIEIPQFGTKHSLNISVCAGIVLWEICNKFFQKK